MALSDMDLISKLREVADKVQQIVDYGKSEGPEVKALAKETQANGKEWVNVIREGADRIEDIIKK